jgi:multidrug efflux pump
MTTMENIVTEQLPQGFGYDWSGMSYQEILAGNSATLLMVLSIVVVFLCLAALYESWSIPLAVLLVVPLGVLGAVVGVTLRGMPNDVFFKVGLITVIGLSAKNAILIIEFAKDLYAQGKGLIEATLEAAHLRFRPILMTSIAFILGVLPLVISSGAGSASQRAIGTGVMFGMISATVLAVLFVPAFFVAVRRVFKGRQTPPADAAAHDIKEPA